MILGESSDGGDFGDILRSPVKSLGAKSLAGLMAYPQLKPKQIPIASTVRPTKRGTSCLLTYLDDDYCDKYVGLDDDDASIWHI